MREEHTKKVEPALKRPSSVQAQPVADAPAAARLRRATKKSLAVTRVSRVSTRTAASQAKPKELADEDTLILFKGQLVQTSKQRSDGWAFGSVVVDVMDDRPPIGIDGLSTQAGWFPLRCTYFLSTEAMSKLQKKMGDGANEALSAPDDWSPVKDPMVPELFTLQDGPEKQRVIAAFMKTLHPGIKVQEVLRIENMSMWQSYAVKRQTVLQREKDDAAGKATSASRFERVWLFHGTDQETVPKIIEMGFNRSFCGKNATRFGKGVYFARVRRPALIPGPLRDAVTCGCLLSLPTQTSRTTRVRAGRLVLVVDDVFTTECTRYSAHVSGPCCHRRVLPGQE